MNIQIAGPAREVAVKALEFLISENDADHLQAPAQSLLTTFKAKPGGGIPVDTASLNGEALATALEDILDSNSLSESEDSIANGLLDQF